MRTWQSKENRVWDYFGKKEGLYREFVIGRKIDQQ